MCGIASSLPWFAYAPARNSRSVRSAGWRGWRFHCSSAITELPRSMCAIAATRNRRCRSGSGSGGRCGVIGGSSPSARYDVTRRSSTASQSTSPPVTAGRASPRARASEWIDALPKLDGLPTLRAKANSTMFWSSVLTRPCSAFITARAKSELAMCRANTPSTSVTLQILATPERNGSSASRRRIIGTSKRIGPALAISSMSPDCVRHVSMNGKTDPSVA